MIKLINSMYVQFGDGTVQMNILTNTKNGHPTLGFRNLKTPNTMPPIDPTKTPEDNGFVCFLEFSTVESVEKVIRALSSIRRKMKEKENAEY